jgi:hypothetical protein
MFVNYFLRRNNIAMFSVLNKFLFTGFRIVHFMRITGNKEIDGYKETFKCADT